MATNEVAGSDIHKARTKIRSADVALRAGVSRSTVSVVLNGRHHPIIAAGTRERVRQAARELNYRPNQLARALITGTSHLIGLWMWSLPSPYSVSLIQHALSDVRRDGFHALLFEALPDDDSTPNLDPAQWPIDGLITVVERELIERFLSQHATAPPIVSIGAGAFDVVDNVQFDIQGGVRRALEHLSALGRKPIVFVAPEFNDDDSDERFQSYVRYCQETGMDRKCIFFDFRARSRENVMKAVKEYIDSEGCPGGLLCFNDEVAIAVNRQLRDMGIAVPQDAAIVGCDDWLETQFQHPQLSTIQLPIEEACDVAWTFLKNRMANPGLARQHITLDTRLIVRGSSSDAA